MLYTITDRTFKTSAAPSKSILSRVQDLIEIWAHRRSSRLRLGALPPERLKDIGIEPDAARHEASKFFWEI